MIVVRDAAGLAEIGAINARDGGGLAEIGEAIVRDAGGLQVVFSPTSGMSADVTPDVYGAAASGSSVAVTTSTAIVTVSGGVAPFTYAWARTDAEAEVWTILSPSSSATQFRCASVPPIAEPIYATFACTVTDSIGNVATTANVDASVINYSSGGGA